MPKFRKKPIVIEAKKWLGGTTSASEIEEWTRGSGREIVWDGRTKLSVPTEEGIMTANIGDWIIRGVKDEVYPCKPDIFKATYELVEE